MTSTDSQNAFGFPGMEPRWTHANKDGIGTAYLASNRVWFTLWKGIITEVYYPTADRPQIRDLQFLITDGKSFFHDEKHNLEHKMERMDPALGYRITTSAPEGRYVIEKQVITDPHLPCVLLHTRLKGDDNYLAQLKLYVLCAPHLEAGGWGNNAYIGEVMGQQILMAEKGGRWLVLAATCPFSRLSVGYVGYSDGWTDLADGYQMDYQFDQALDGNVALTGEIEVEHYKEFTIGLAFGENRHSAITTLLQAFGIPFEEQLERFKQQWQIANEARSPLLESHAKDGGNLYRSSYNILLAHEAKTYQGALIASLAIPWGEAKSDTDGVAGYHLVWSRDMIQSAHGLLAAGNHETPLRSLIYLAASQRADGSFPQNFWIDGQPYWTGIQLDEMAFPIMFARRLYRENVLRDFDPTVMVMRAIKYLISQGPVTEQERWEEQSGYSPSTLAVSIAACICAASFVREQGDVASAEFLEDYADWLRFHLEAWTVTNEGTLLEDVKRHFVRINPVEPGQVALEGSVDQAMVSLTSQPPDAPAAYPAKEIVDAGFLELVRCGVLAPDDPLIVDSLRVVDATIKVDTPFGPCWRRYNHDGYGQREDGSAYMEWGKGRAWPLLTAERGLYEMAAGRDVTPYLQALERFAMETGLLPEQVWDAPDLPEAHMYLGQATGSARPLLWAHAKYISLLRSVQDDQLYDIIPEVASRYLNGMLEPKPLEMWSFNYPLSVIKKGETLRVFASAPFRLRWSVDDWQNFKETDCSATAIAIYFVDVAIALVQHSPLHFTFFWTNSQSWENRDFSVAVR